MTNPHSRAFVEARRIDLINAQIELKRQLAHDREEPTFGDPIDRAEAETARRIKAANFVRVMRELAEIDAALTRISRGTYGVCEQDGESIDEERLIAVPTARYNVHGQIKHERKLTRLEEYRRRSAVEDSAQSILGEE